MISHISVHYKNLGRLQRWTSGKSPLENPCLSKSVKYHLAMKEKEAEEALVQPIQATPIFSTEIHTIIDSYQNKLRAQKGSSHRIPWLQQIAFVLLLDACGRRPGDIKRLNINLCLYLPDKRGIFFVMVLHKTCRTSGPDRFVVKRDNTKEHCPIHAIEEYIRTCIKYGIDFNKSSLLFPNLAVPQLTQRSYAWSSSNITLNTKASTNLINTTAKEVGFTFDAKLYGMRSANALTSRFTRPRRPKRSYEKGGLVNDKISRTIFQILPRCQAFKFSDQTPIHLDSTPLAKQDPGTHT
ncbi:hypothetical protein BCR33DRAFT_808075 [Rhizoclosmatium globosum]|uniref:Uncharacterized protein n=1 Tax=Rhizoclosmatium globosum TaxID=329046 RepID=A0A1Y2ARR7_9FUNG|nr:hypothetical protein BCR33DRAFT_808075 [Rhizoclosmatium globosum]|eukprot:ORY24655.1 hypothetical protein BCR33DRAFT_808075 [Rhizoclosmatium globosum]